MNRPWTPSTSTTIVMKRGCNGCGTQLGDVTDQEMACGINGLPLPDVRRECTACAPAAPEPKCLPIAVVWGDRRCGEMECDHAGGGDSYGTSPVSYCDKVTEQTICLTHSTVAVDGAIARAVPWPCQHVSTPATA
ncbi:hypothetical protein [Streptomyces sp. NPDC088794]|uniref:hypothetical protein n=1 Tax=Streptomyces sp. NPDC088794 TaxID=3365902 RepID=UPI0037F41E4C